MILIKVIANNVNKSILYIILKKYFLCVWFLKSQFGRLYIP